jgi:hypothetical protein
VSISRKKLEYTRKQYAEFKRLITTGNREDVATMLAIVEVSGFLSEAVPYLLDEIERLQGKQVKHPPFMQFDGRGGTA